MGILRIERHELGPWLYVLGRRVHECHVGIALLAATAVLMLLGVDLERSPAALLLGTGAWLVWKDWHDLFSHSRDSTAWRVGVHRAPRPLRIMHSPAGRFDRLLARIVTLGNPFFQIESLYRFNAKFSPRWQPRYLLYEPRPFGFARTGLAAMWAEGQLPKPRLRSAS